MLLIVSPSKATDFSCIVQSQQARERDLAARIQRGEEVRDETILHLQPTIKRMASRLYQRHYLYTNEEQAIEPADLMQAANVRLLEKFSRARFQRKPLAWLCIVAANAMRDCLNGRGDAIKREPGRQAIPLLKLSALFPGDWDETFVTLEEMLPCEIHLPGPSTTDPALLSLKQAVEALPEKQRAVITLHFGLDAHSPIPLRQISREFSPGIRKPCSAEHHYRRALRALRQTLSHEFSQPTRAGGAQ